MGSEDGGKGKLFRVLFVDGVGPGRGDSDGFRVAGSWAREGDVIWVTCGLGSGHVTSSGRGRWIPASHFIFAFATPRSLGGADQGQSVLAQRSQKLGENDDSRLFAESLWHEHDRVV